MKEQGNLRSVCVPPVPLADTKSIVGLLASSSVRFLETDIWTRTDSYRNDRATSDLNGLKKLKNRKIQKDAQKKNDPAYDPLLKV